ncbi:hypothetical protein F5Y17DRAFT_422069 [Xylariaceae sp. FL0594]|nr:hypothetical protein F5Y17DRAFT_422069 [Xylariaceae sp. FL0594]
MDIYACEEELSSLLSRNLTLDRQQQQQQQQQQHVPPEFEPIKYSISQHYHHSAHVVQENNAVTAFQRPSFEPAGLTTMVEQVLSHHGIDPSCLSPPQLELFKTADSPQKIRLLELWQICPPKRMENEHALAWTATTMELEETAASLRHESRVQGEESAQRNSLLSLDGTPPTPVQSSDGHWVHTADVEPYMMSGYEMLAQREYEESMKRQLEEDMPPTKGLCSPFGGVVGTNNYRPATDPVYASDAACRQRAMENQYGAYQQMDEMEF